ncbi:MAG: UDP-glucose 4-epimerase GalE [Christensenellaceae bacterium]|jgi:UDP-glucose 4-epimerase|nr:UDP-glucose 4-epimerase GalE [Christensenellaceae bacterium]
MRKTVLVTGGAGYIATHTIVALHKSGFDVVAIDNFSNSDKKAIENTEKIIKSKIKFYQGDVCDSVILERIFSENKISIVIHFAGLKAVGESCLLPIKYYRNNIDSTLTLIEVMSKYNVKELVFSSSATVYGLPKTLPITEDMPLSTTNPYGSTKLTIETILRDLYASDKTWRIALLRYFNPVGAHESGLIGENPKGIPNNLMPYVAQVAIGKLEYLNIFGNDYDTPDGTGVRDYIHVMDLAEGHLAAIENIDKFTITALNLGTGHGYSVLDMVVAFEKACNKEIKYKICPRRAGDIASCYASPDLAKSILNWTAKRGLDEMCRDLWNFQINNKD